MAGIIKKTVAKVTNNPILSVAGAVGGFYLAKKYGVTNKWHLAGFSVLGLGIGAFASSYYKQVASQPTKKSV